MGFRTLVWRSLRLRCPVCGVGRLFTGLFRMHSRCGHCEATFEREAGFFLGSIYFNYGLTALVVAIAYPVLLFTRTASENTLLISALAFTLLFPIWFHRYARALWLGFDQFMDPRNRRDADVDEELLLGAGSRGSASPPTGEPPATAPILPHSTSPHPTSLHPAPLPASPGNRTASTG